MMTAAQTIAETDKFESEGKHEAEQECRQFENERIASMILLDIIENLHVFSLIHEVVNGINCKMTDDTKDDKQKSDFVSEDIQKLEKTVNEVPLTDAQDTQGDKVPFEVKEVKLKKTEEALLDVHEKAQLLHALNLSSYQRKCNQDGSEKIKEKQEEYKKRGVHFNSPVATVYELSESSQTASDSSTQILSDSEDFPLSQTKCTETGKFKVKNEDNTDYNTVLKYISTANMDESEPSAAYTEEVMLTAGGDCYNSRLLSDNYAPGGVNLQVTFDKGTNETIKKSVCISNKTNNSNEKEKIEQEYGERYCVDKTDEVLAKDKLKQSVKELQLSQINFKGEKQEIGESEESVSGLNKLLKLDEEENTGYFKGTEVNTDDCNCVAFVLNSESLVHQNQGTLIFNDCKEVETVSNSNKELVSTDSSTIQEDHRIKDTANTCDNTEIIENGSEVFTKIPIMQEDRRNCSQDLFVNFNDTDEKPSELIQLVSVTPETILKADTNDDGTDYLNRDIMCSETVCIGQKETIGEIIRLNDDALSQAEKREKYSPDLHSSQLSKKRKSEFQEMFVTHSRKRKQTDHLDESINVKVLKICSEDTDDSFTLTENISVPKLLRQLAGDTLSNLDETVVWESPEDLSKECMKKESTYMKDTCVEVAVQSHGSFQGKNTGFDEQVDQIDYSDSSQKDQAQSLSTDTSQNLHEEETEKSVSTRETDRDILSISLVTQDANKIGQELHILPETNGAELEEYSHTLKNQENKTSTGNQNVKMDTNCDEPVSLSQPSEDLQLSAHQSEMEKETSQISLAALNPDTTYGAQVLLSEMSGEFQDNAETSEFTSDIYHELGFITATEVLSQSSQNSGSTGFIVNAEEFYGTQELPRSEYSDAVGHGLTTTLENDASGSIFSKEKVFKTEQKDIEINSVSSIKHKSIVEIAVDGFKEERLHDQLEDITPESIERNVELDDLEHVVTDQDEQIDTDQLDMFIDKAVDQVVPEDISSIAVETDTENVLLRNEEAQKLKLYACDSDLCDEQDRPLCNPVNRSGKIHEQCFNWKYRPSCDLDNDTPIPELPDEDHVVRITPLKTCGKPLRLGLSKRQPVKSSLHRLAMRK